MKIPPPQLLMQVANDPSPDNYRNVEHVRLTVDDALGAAGHRLKDFDRILDFGCGVGRLLQALHLARRPGQELFGCDVNEACATWCRENLDFADVRHTALEPPLPYPEQSFDLVVAISVFTHLSRPLQVAWARELMRVLRPGGVALITTCGLGTLADVLALTRWNRRELALLGASAPFFCFAEGDGSDIEGQREVIALHSLDAAVRIFSPLRLAFHADISGLAAGQDISVFVKPTSPCGVASPLQSPALANAVGAAKPFHRFVKGGSRAGGPPDGIDAEIPASGTVSNIVTQRFEIDGDGPARFGTYVAFAERRFDLVHLAVECRLRDAATSHTLAQARFSFPSTTSWGKVHFVPLAVDVPAATCDVELALVTRRAPWQSAPIRFRWWDSRIEFGVGAAECPEAGARQAPAEMTRLEERLVAFS